MSEGVHPAINYILATVYWCFTIVSIYILISVI
jgi:hypothetical protein